ncbi:MAG: TrkH family potassium uptake protein, partial [Bacteroidaceae bacterium]|nr:TrkH family potassium uptake protein [Bacteroidaceae bacterium]
MKRSIFGMLLMMEGLMLTITFLVSLLYAEDDGLAFLTSALMAFAVGSTLKSIGKKSTEKHLTRADSFLVVTLSWVLFSIIGMMPFILHLRMP